MTAAKKRQPKALFLLCFTSMWECFSYYGMRALLVLYMIGQLSYTQADAFSIYGLYTMLVELLAIAGGYCADKIWGVRSSVFLGAVLIAIGHLFLALNAFPAMFFIGLGFIIVGSSFFKPNLKALLGSFYEKEDLRRDEGFTLFYTGMNVGGFLATVACGYAAQVFGWHIGFGLAGFGMLLGMGMLVAKRVLLNGKGNSPKGISWFKKVLCGVLTLIAVGIAALILRYHGESTYFAPLIGIGGLIYLFLQTKGVSFKEKRSIFIIVGSVFLLMIYFALDELMGSLLAVFSSTYVSTQVGGIIVPSSVLIAANPLTIILLGVVISKFSLKISFFGKITTAFLFLAAGFFLLYMGTLFPNTAQLVSVFFPLFSYVCIAVGELFIAPTIYAYCSREAPEHLKGMFMGLVALGFSYGSFFSGTLAQIVNPHTLNDYTYLFLGIMLFTLLLAASLKLFLKKRVVNVLELS
ncbi:MAG: peptide MFS transporter [Chlamydiota bacterium]